MESTSEQTTNSTDDSDTLNFPEELNTLKHELSAINIDQTTRLVTVENRLNRLRKLLPPDSLQLTKRWLHSQHHSDQAGSERRSSA